MALFAVFKKDFQTENLFEIQRAMAQFTIKESGYPFELKNKSALACAQCARHDLCKLARHMSCDRPCRVVSCRLDFVSEKNFCQDGARQNMFSTF